MSHYGQGKLQLSTRRSQTLNKHTLQWNLQISDQCWWEICLQGLSTIKEETAIYKQTNYSIHEINTPTYHFYNNAQEIKVLETALQLWDTFMIYKQNAIGLARYQRTKATNKLQSMFENHSWVFYPQHDKRITMACTNQRINMLMDRFFGKDCYLLMRSLESLAYKERTSKQTTNYACTKGMHTVKSTRLQMIFQM